MSDSPLSPENRRGSNELLVKQFSSTSNVAPNGAESSMEALLQAFSGPITRHAGVCAHLPFHVHMILL